MCALRAGQRGRKVLLLDHADEVGKKILISGGGRCNFTNRNVAPERYLSNNPHFCKSALKGYTQHDFLALIKKHKIAHHEKTLGQLFCNTSAREIVAMLLAECQAADVEIRTSQPLLASAKRTLSGFKLSRKFLKRPCLCWQRAGFPFPRWARPISVTASPRNSIFR
jgi:hypothetical protein